MTAAPQLSQDKRRFPRRAVLWAGKLYFDGHLHDCTVWNISLGGAKIRMFPIPPHGTPVTLSMNRFGEFQGHIVWSDDNTFGLQFVQPYEQIEKLMGETAQKLGLSNFRGRPGRR